MKGWRGLTVLCLVLATVTPSSALACVVQPSDETIERLQRREIAQADYIARATITSYERIDDNHAALEIDVVEVIKGGPPPRRIGMLAFPFQKAFRLPTTSERRFPRRS